MKESNGMKESNQKIMAFVLGIVIGAGAIYSYNNYFVNTSASGKNYSGQNFAGRGGSGSFNGGQMTDEQLTKMATRVGMSKDDLKKEIDSGKTVRQIMQEKGIQFGGRGGSGSTGGAGNFSGGGNN